MSEKEQLSSPQTTGMTEAEKKAQALLEEKEAEMRVRVFDTKANAILSILLVIWSIFQLYANTIGTMSAMTLRAWHIMFLLVFTFCLYPTFKKER